MRRSTVFIVILMLIIVVAVVLGQIIDGYAVSVEVDMPNGILVGDIYDTPLNGIVTYLSGKTSSIYIYASSLTAESLELLNEPGEHTFYLNYANRQFPFNLKIVANTPIEYGDFTFLRNKNVITLSLDKYEGGKLAVIPSDVSGLAVTSINGGAFDGVYLDELCIPYSVTELKKEAFKNIKGLRYLFIPNSVNKIGDDFIANSSILSLRFEGDIQSPSVMILNNSGFSGMSFYIDNENSELYDVLYNATYPDGTPLSLNINDRKPKEIPEQADTDNGCIFGRERETGSLSVFPCDAYQEKTAVCEGDVISALRLGYKPSPKKDSLAEELWSASRALLSSALTEGLSEYEIARNILDALCKNTSYVSDYSDDPLGVVHTAYGAIVCKTAVCDGYAYAYELLCNMAGVECLFLRGKLNKDSDVGHAWNKVRIDNEWYVVDATFSDITIKSNDENITEIVSYTSFLTSDASEPRICNSDCPVSEKDYILPQKDMPVFYSKEEFCNYIKQNADAIIDARFFEFALLFELTAQESAAKIVQTAIYEYFGPIEASLKLMQNNYLNSDGQALLIIIW